MSNVLTRSNLLRAAVLVLGAAASAPAFAETDALPLGANERGASSVWSGAAAPATAAIGPVISFEGGSMGDVRGAYGAYAGRTPLAHADAAVAGDPTVNANMGAN